MYRYPVQSYVLQPIETVANEVSMYIYISMCQSRLARPAPDVDCSGSEVRMI